MLCSPPSVRPLDIEVLAVQKEVLYHFVSQPPSVFREVSPDFDFLFSALKSIPILGTR